MKTPEQIRDMEFQSSPVGGYKKSDVDLFLEEVASEIEILMKQKLEADRKLQEISKKAPEAALSSAGIQNVLISAQRVAEQITDDAKASAETIIADANLKLTEAGMKAQEIITDAEKNASLLGRTAESEATKIIAEAVKKSEEIVAAATESVELQQKLYDRLKIEVSDFKKKAVTQFASVLELINQLPDEIPFNIERAKNVLSVDFNDPSALLNNAVEERLAKEKAEAEALEAKKLAEEQAAILKDTEESKVAHDDGAIPVAAPVSVEIKQESVEKTIEVPVEEPSSETAEQGDNFQLTFPEEENAGGVVEETTAEQPKCGFIIDEDEVENQKPKGRISFGDDDDEDDDDDDDDDDYTGFFFKKRKK